MTVGMIVGLVAFGHTTNEILTDYPYIDEEDIQQALAYTAWLVEEFEVPLPTAISADFGCCQLFSKPYRAVPSCSGYNSCPLVN